MGDDFFLLVFIDLGSILYQYGFGVTSYWDKELGIFFLISTVLETKRETR